MSNSVVFTFLRANPPTKGHEKLIKRLLKESETRGARHLVFLSHTMDGLSNPLSWQDRIKMCCQAFPGVTFSCEENILTPYQALEYLAEEYDNVCLVVGSDRANSFKKGMRPYAKQWGIKKFEVVSAGHRNNGNKTLAGISGSKARRLVRENKESEFEKLIPDTLSNKYKKVLFKKLKRRLHEI